MSTLDLVKEYGPLSWQQAMNLRRNSLLDVSTGQVTATVSLPADEPVERVQRRLAEMVRREEALRITHLPDGGHGPATYREPFDPPLETVRVDSMEEMASLIGEMSEPRFSYRDDKDPRPLWQAVVFDYPDPSGGRARTAFAALDHCLADGRSGQLFRDELAGDVVRTARRGGYREWIAWQHENFPMDGAAKPTPARDFWRGYFDSSAPNRAAALPFCRPRAPMSGLEHHMYREVPVAGHEIAATAAARRVSPFMLFLACVASAVGTSTGETDLTVRYVAHGRIPRYLETLGWFSDYVPLRIRTADLADPDRALDAALRSRAQLGSHESTPWGYVMQSCGQTDAETPQVVLNFSTRSDRVTVLPDTTVTSTRGFLYLEASIPRSGKGLLRCRFDPVRFAIDGVDAFVGAVFDPLKRLVAARPWHGGDDPCTVA